MSNRSSSSILNDVIYKNFTIIWFTFRQLMFSRLNIGIIILVLIPLLISSLYATDAFPEGEEERYDDTDIYYDPTLDRYYFDDRTPPASVEITEDNIKYAYNENTFSINVEGISSGQITSMEVKFVYYYNLNDYNEILDDLLGLLESPGPPSGEPGNDKNTVGEDLFVTWNYTKADHDNWTSCTNQFYGTFGSSLRDLDSYQYWVRTGRLNVMPYAVEEQGIIVQFGYINLSGFYTNSGWSWDYWKLQLEFGKLDYVIFGTVGSELGGILDPGYLKEIEKTRLYWPNQITIFIDAFDNSTGEDARVGQAVYSTKVNNPRDSGEIAEVVEPEGHLVFIDAATGLFFIFLIPIIILLYTSSATADDKENRTITYFTSRPISKVNLLMSKYISAYLASFIMIVPSLVLTYFIMSGYKDGMDMALDNVRILGVFLGILILALFIYSAVFTFISTLIRHPLIVGLTYIFFFDQLISNLPFAINRIGISYYLNSIAYANLISYTEIFIYKPMDPWDAGIILVVATMIMLVFANLFYNEKDFH